VTIDTKKQVSLRATEVILPPVVALIATAMILPSKTASLWESAKCDCLRRGFTLKEGGAKRLKG